MIRAVRVQIGAGADGSGGRGSRRGKREIKERGRAIAAGRDQSIIIGVFIFIVMVFLNIYVPTAVIILFLVYFNGIVCDVNFIIIITFIFNIGRYRALMVVNLWLFRSKMRLFFLQSPHLLLLLEQGPRGGRELHLLPERNGVIVIVVMVEHTVIVLRGAAVAAQARQTGLVAIRVKKRKQRWDSRRSR